MRIPLLLSVFIGLAYATDVFLGGDEHDYKPHQKEHLIGGGDHDYYHSKKPTKEHLIGGGDHDYYHSKKPTKAILGGDDHDKQSHGKKLLGGGDHDLVPHGKKLLGGGDHDLLVHGKKLLGGGDHDLVSHGKKLLGGGDHDLLPHGKKMLGGDGHDKLPHGKKSFGGDKHDKVPHGKKLLGSDGHDKLSHGKKLLGSDDHDKQSHGKKIIGGDKHDYIQHKKNMLGGDGHDKLSHGKKLLGSGKHDYIPHGKKSNKVKDFVKAKKQFGKDKHDYEKHSEKKVLGGKHDFDYAKKKPTKAKKVLPNGKHNHHNKQKRVDKLKDLNAFHSFMQHHNKTYKNDREYQKRFSIFRANQKKVSYYQKAERGTATYGITKFSDMTQKEFRKMLGFRPELKGKFSAMKKATIPDVTIPTEFDWREEEVVTPVKNQGMCGSCWAFSTTGNVEGQWAIKHGKLYSLSEQELVDCDSTDHGCNGGLPENAYQIIHDLGGLETESAYPYDAKEEQCAFDKSKVKVTVNSSVELPESEDDLAKWLVKNGPISIGINANPLQFYTGGVSHPLKFMCRPEDLDHGMLIVGYGVHTTKYLHRTQPYWIIKNSWGPDWGEKGYYRIYRGDGSCGVNRMATSAIVN